MIVPLFVVVLCYSRHISVMKSWSEREIVGLLLSFNQALLINYIYIYGYNPRIFLISSSLSKLYTHSRHSSVMKSWSEREIVALAAAVQSGSSHPFAAAVINVRSLPQSLSCIVVSLILSYLILSY